MQSYPYLIVGGGMTAFTAIQGIREMDSTNPIGLFSLESYPPYSRPPLSKGLWKGKPLEKIWLKGNDEGVELHLGQRIHAIDPQRKQVHDSLGEIYSYDQLLLATGGKLRRLPFGEGHVIYYRTLDDYQQLRNLTGQGKHFLVLGSGFIGSELAAALAMNGEKVTMLFPDPGIGSRIFPPDLSKFVTAYYCEKGVDVLSGPSMTGIEERADHLLVKTDQGELQVDHIVAGIGILPDTGLAESAGLHTENGISVDEFLRSAQPDIFAAGDVAAFFSPTLGKRIRVEHEDNSLSMGKHAGKNMALQASSGELIPYHHLPFFYSDLFDLGYEAVGELDARLEMVSDWQEQYKTGVIYYLNDKRVRGVLLWNVWGKVDAARQLISEPGPFSVQTLKALQTFK
jgi:3-phenylpropionate/trans-cinnamate dioxygenase ferredoxin reductase component